MLGAGEVAARLRVGFPPIIRLGSAAAVIGWVAIALAVPYVLVIGGTLNTANVLPEGRIALQLLTIAAGIAGLVAAARRPALLASPVVAAGAVYVLATAISAIGSQRPAASVEATALLILSAPCYLAVRVVAWDERLIRRVRWLIVVTAFLVLIPYVIQVLVAWATWWSALGPGLPPIRPGIAGGTVGHPNVLATYAYLLVPYAVWTCWSWRRGRMLSAILITVAVFALVTTGTRGAWIGSVAGLAVGGALLAREHRGLIRSLSRSTFVVAVGIAVVALMTINPWIYARLAAGDSSRLELWAAAFSIFRRFPVLGGGPGSWPGLRPAEPVLNGGTAALMTAHNSLLHTAAELGLVGLVAGVMIVGAVILVAWRTRSAATSQRQAETAVILGSVAALLVHSLVDPYFILAAVVLTTMYLVARLEGPAAHEPTPDRAHRRARWGLVVAASGMVLATVALVRTDAAMLAATAGTEALDHGSWTRAETAFDRATSAHDLGLYELGRAIALSRQGRTEEAALALERQAATDPITSSFAGIAVLREQTDPDAARAAALQVQRAGAYDPTATLNAAGVLDRFGDPSAAEMTADVLVGVPFIRLEPLPAGPVTPETWRAAISAAIERLRSTDPLAAASLALEADRFEVALELASSATASAERTVFLAYAAARTGADASLSEARAMLIEDPTRRSVIWYGRIARLLGSEQDRAQAARMAAAISGPAFDSVRVDLDDDPSETLVAQLQGYPRALSFRLGPSRPYVAGMTTLSFETWRP